MCSSDLYFLILALLYGAIGNVFIYLFLVENEISLKLNSKNRFSTLLVTIQPTAISLQNSNKVHRQTRKRLKLRIKFKTKISKPICTSVSFLVDVSNAHLGNLIQQQPIAIHNSRHNSVGICLVVEGINNGASIYFNSNSLSIPLTT